MPDELDELRETVNKINSTLGVLCNLGGGPFEDEFSSFVETAVQDFKRLLPDVRNIYDRHKDTSFCRSTALNHGLCNARTWHDIVLQTAEGFVEGSRLLNSRNACQILHRSQYESGKVQIHLELESEYACKAKSPPPTKASALPLNLHLCDVPQTIKRDGFRDVVLIKNAEHWRLMQALIAAYPNAVPESKLKCIFQGRHDRDNYTRALKNSIDAIGLTIENWVLTAMK